MDANSYNHPFWPPNTYNLALGWPKNFARRRSGEITDGKSNGELVTPSITVRKIAPFR